MSVLGTSDNSVYGAGEGYPSTGGESVFARAFSASSSCNREPQSVDHLATGDAMTSSDAPCAREAPGREGAKSGPTSANVIPTAHKVRKSSSSSSAKKERKSRSKMSSLRPCSVVLDRDVGDSDSASTSSTISSMSIASKVSSTNKRAHSPSGLSDASRKRSTVDTGSAAMPPPAPPSTFSDAVKSSSAKKKTPTVEERGMEMRDLLPSEIVAELLLASRSVEKTAITSGNLKGTSVRSLKEAARLLEAGVKELERRNWRGMGETITKGSDPATSDSVSDSPQSILWDRIQEENRSLRNENAALRRELRDIKESLKAIREEMMTTKRSQVAGAANGSSSSSDPRSMTIDEVVEKGPMSTPAPLPTPPPQSTGSGAERLLLAKISALMDAKFLAFRRELGSSPEETATTKSPGTSGLFRGVVGVSSGSSTSNPSTSTSTLAPSAPSFSPSAFRNPPQEEKKKKKKKKKKTATAAETSTSTPPSPSTPTGPTGNPAKETWSEVVGRRKKKESKKKEGAPTSSSFPNSIRERRKTPDAKRPKVGTSPRTAAITITVLDGVETTYAEAVHRVRTTLDLQTFGLDSVKWRKAVTGGLVLEIPGAEGHAKADALAAKMGEVLHNMGVKVARPVKKAEFRLTGLEPSLTPGEVVAAVAKAGACPPEAVRLGDIKHPHHGLGTVWVQCPVSAARAIIKVGTVKMGWTLARAVLLENRPMQCFRCLALGHVRQRCTAAVDRSEHCYRCGSPSHKAAVCSSSQPHCPVCQEAGRKADHKAGSKACSPPPKRTKRDGKGGNVAPPAANEGKKGKKKSSQPPSEMEVDPTPDGNEESQLTPSVSPPESDQAGKTPKPNNG